ncbi:MAG: low specificity L-threonine aldolase [Gammaproteobacteria bacterium]|nr:low specificity L-threonine aldolase [Gammaproteobacteria bacterium]
MLNFMSDYMEGCHPSILEALNSINYNKSTGYGLDEYSLCAKELIKKSFALKEDSLVYFLPGGTITNKTLIDSLIRGYESIISADTGHINVHEAGAIEASGRKIIALKNKGGKLVAKDIENYMDNLLSDETNEHITVPRLLYISFPTETGTLYSKKELEALREVTLEYNLLLYIDGARLGYGLVSPKNDIKKEELKDLCDAFYIGGTKVGALFGEALVINNKTIAPHLFTSIKRNGALMSKGFVTGMEFLTLFKNDLYFKISKNAIDMALKIKKSLVDLGYKLYADSYTNQQFFIIPKDKSEKLKSLVSYNNWGYLDNGDEVIRLVASWATTMSQVDELIEVFKNL